MEGGKSFGVDGRTRYSKLVAFVKRLDQEKEYHLDELKNKMMIEIATSDKVLSDSLHLLVEMGLIKERIDKPFWFVICKNDNRT